MVKIYSLNDPVSLKIRYIGKTIQSLKKRLSGHLTSSKYSYTKSHVGNWINSLLIQNLKPLICLIEYCSEDDWEDREKYWISYYKNQICNYSIGGKPSSLGYKFTAEHKLKISKSLTGRKRTKEECLKISNGKKGVFLKQSTKDLLRKANLGKKQSLETRIKKSKYYILQIDAKTNEIIAEYPTLGYAQEATGFLKGNIVSAINGRLKTYKGFKWAYKK